VLAALKTFLAFAVGILLGALACTLALEYRVHREEAIVADLAIAEATKAESAVARVAAIERNHDLGGTWVGLVRLVSPGEPNVSSGLQLCLLLNRQQQSRVVVREDGTWRELKPGSFSTARLGPTAVLSALTAGQPNGGSEWVEAWAVTVTRSVPATAKVAVSRTVNNLQLSAPSVDARFTFQGHGELEHAQQCG
jgi:hypothetical protein